MIIDNKFPEQIPDSSAALRQLLDLLVHRPDLADYLTLTREELILRCFSHFASEATALDHRDRLQTEADENQVQSIIRDEAINNSIQEMCEMMEKNPNKKVTTNYHNTASGERFLVIDRKDKKVRFEIYRFYAFLIS